MKSWKRRIIQQKPLLHWANRLDLLLRHNLRQQHLAWWSCSSILRVWNVERSFFSSGGTAKFSFAKWLEILFEEEIIARATDFEFQPAVPIRTCSSEDLVVLKAFASRPQDWVDIRGILIRQKPYLDRTAIINRLSPLVELKEEPQILDKLQELFREVPARTSR